MKTHLLSLISVAILCLCLATGGNAPDPIHQQNSEYATIRWSRRDNTCIIRPSGQAEFIGVQLAKAKKPDRVDDRFFYMNIAMNALAKEGYEFAGIS